jgi:hypothetical protein
MPQILLQPPTNFNTKLCSKTFAIFSCSKILQKHNTIQLKVQCFGCHWMGRNAPGVNQLQVGVVRNNVPCIHWGYRTFIGRRIWPKLRAI